MATDKSAPALPKVGEVWVVRMPVAGEIWRSEDGETRLVDSVSAARGNVMFRRYELSPNLGRRIVTYCKSNRAHWLLWAVGATLVTQSAIGAVRVDDKEAGR